MALNREFSIVPIVAGALIIIVVTFFISISSSSSKAVMVQVGSGIFKADVAATEESRQKGLSGVTELGPDKALLMVFPDSQKWGIWMKDMKIPIDIVWLDENKTVIYAVTDASPTQSTSQAFIPKTPAKYVIEMPAGSIKSKAIKIGGSAVFDANSIIGIK